MTRRWSRRVEALAPAVPAPDRVPDRGRARPAGLGPTVSTSPTSRGRSTPSAPSAHRADGIEHLVVFPMYKQNGSRDTCFEALICAPVARVDRRARAHALRQPEVRPGGAARLHPRLRQRVRGPVPRDGLVRRRAGRTTSVRSSATARPSACAGSPGRRPTCCGLNLPPDAALMLASPAVSAAGLHPLGPDPRPRPQPRRAAVRPVHDPPARAVLDVLAGGAALRPDRVRARLSTLERDGARSRATSSTRSCSTGCCGSRSPAARVRNYDGLGGQLLFAYLHRHGQCTGPTTSSRSSGSAVGGRRAGLHEEVAELYRPASTARSSGTGRRPTTSSPRAWRRRTGSRWAAGARDFEDVEDPRPYVDHVLDDEFPLSIFYSSLKAKLAAVTSSPGPRLRAPTTPRPSTRRCSRRSRAPTSATRRATATMRTPARAERVRGAVRRAGRGVLRVQRNRRERALAAAAAGRGRR